MILVMRVNVVNVRWQIRQTSKVLRIVVGNHYFPRLSTESLTVIVYCDGDSIAILTEVFIVVKYWRHQCLATYSRYDV